MKIRRYKSNVHHLLNEPLDKKDINIFMHCSGGSIAVKTRVLNSEVIPMLFLHGIKSIEIVDDK